MIIAPAVLADLDAIDEIERHSFPQPWPRSAFETELTRPLARLDVARAPRVIGFCNYWIVSDPEGDAGEVHIHTIATHPDHRRADVGAALLDRALAEGRAAHCNLATLEVRRARQALGLSRDPIAVSVLGGDGDGIAPLWRAVVQLAAQPRPPR